MILMSDFDEGNRHPGTRCHEQLTRFLASHKGREKILYRADAASYTKAIINTCQQEGVEYAIGAPCTPREEIREGPDTAWKTLIDEQGHETGYEVAEITYRTIGSRYIVARRASQEPLCIDFSERSRFVTV